MYADPMSDLTVEPYTNWRSSKYFWEPAYTWNGMQLVKSVIDKMSDEQLATGSERSRFYAAQTINVTYEEIDIYGQILKARRDGSIHFLEGA